jgi:hypothetical protein
MAVVKSVIVGPMRAGFGCLFHCGKERVVLGRVLQRFNPDVRPFRQQRPWWENDYSILDFSSYAHVYLLIQMPRKSKLGVSLVVS